MKKYIKPSIEVIEIKTPTLTVTSLRINDEEVNSTDNDFTLGSKGSWVNSWDDEMD